MNTSIATERRRWMGALSKACPVRLATLWESTDARPDYRLIRSPETGLIMVRGRVGGQGDRFNLGEMTLTRCAVRLASGETGLSYMGGRHKRGAEIAAVVDAMMQSDQWRQRAAELVAELDGERQAGRRTVARRREATRVDFFTMTRSREQK